MKTDIVIKKIRRRKFGTFAVDEIDQRIVKWRDSLDNIKYHGVLE